MLWLAPEIKMLFKTLILTPLENWIAFFWLTWAGGIIFIILIKEYSDELLDILIL